MIAEFWIDVAPVVYLVSVPVVVFVALVFGLALARQAAHNDLPLSEREAVQRVRPRGGVSSIEPVDGAAFPGRVDLNALDRELASILAPRSERRL